MESDKRSDHVNAPFHFSKLPQELRTLVMNQVHSRDIKNTRLAGSDLSASMDFASSANPDFYFQNATIPEVLSYAKRINEETKKEVVDNLLLYATPEKIEDPQLIGGLLHQVIPYANDQQIGQIVEKSDHVENDRLRCEILHDCLYRPVAVHPDNTLHAEIHEKFFPNLDVKNQPLILRPHPNSQWVDIYKKERDHPLASFPLSVREAQNPLHATIAQKLPGINAEHVGQITQKAGGFQNWLFQESILRDLAPHADVNHLIERAEEITDEKRRCDFFCEKIIPRADTQQCNAMLEKANNFQDTTESERLVSAISRKAFILAHPPSQSSSSSTNHGR